MGTAVVAGLWKKKKVKNIEQNKSDVDRQTDPLHAVQPIDDTKTTEKKKKRKKNVRVSSLITRARFSVFIVQIHTGRRRRHIVVFGPDTHAFERRRVVRACRARDCQQTVLSNVKVLST